MDVDPDGDSSSLCSGCRLPIFSTPSISFSQGGDRLFVHEQCHRAPLEIPSHELHPQHASLVLNHLYYPPPPNAAAATCHNCKEICGTLFYQCTNPSCDFRLDLSCVLQLKIKHKSHNHSMTIIRLSESSSLTCSACDNKHGSLSSQKQQRTLSYLCNLCGYWIHPDCASLLNSIIHYEKHHHSLFLTYNPPTSTHSKCGVCFGDHKKGSGVFLCLSCTDYLVHIKCVLQNHNTFKPVFIRNAFASTLARLPMANEHGSLIPYIRQGSPSMDFTKNHSHPLIYHETDDGDESYRICNACVQFVSPPFYICSKCPDFFLHGCCASLPAEISNHLAHKEGHRLLLYPKTPKSDNIFVCQGCHIRCNGFVYSCETCEDFALDVVCTMMNPAITHKHHISSHILFRSHGIQFRSDEKCNCCSSSLNGICYECSICPNFKLHVRCALLPNMVHHRMFDQHPLQLTTTPIEESKVVDEDFCEVCEEHVKKDRWYYSCSECNQSFHVDCIPFIDQLSRIKSGRNVRVDIHGCPVALVRQDGAVCSGRRCGSCQEILRVCYDGLAYECSKCFFGLHKKCAEKTFVEEL